MSRSMRLTELADGLFAVPEHVECTVTGLTADSRALRPGDAFIAVSGLTAHGLSYLRHDQAANASVVLYETPVPASTFIPGNAIAVPALKQLQARIASRFFAAPSQAMTLVGVTGTNGKTSTVQLIAQAITLLGHGAGTIGTLGAGLYGQLQSGERTTPDVIAVHRTLAELRDAGAQLVAMEVSSHALDQGRVDEVVFDTAVFSNLTLDHLDYHGSMQAYFEAKARLFAWPGLRHAVVNADADYSAALLARLPAGLPCIRTSSRGAAAELQAQSLTLGLEGMRFTLVHGNERAVLVSPLLGRFNVDNLLATAGVLLGEGLSLSVIAGVLARLSPVDGRMSRLGGRHNKPLVVIDYAHTPDALEQVLNTLRGHSQSRLICVFGCGGDRDRSKRPLMAASAEQWADTVWVTDDNPRSESGDVIVAEICAGFQHADAIHVQRDRRAAIAEAIAAAGPQDIVLIAGKGHETYQEVEGVKFPFDDRAVAADCLQEHV